MKWLACVVKRLASVVALSVALGTAALAADIVPPVAPPLRAPAAYIPVAPPYPYNWSGFYIGGNLGAGFNNTGSATDTLQHVWDHNEHLVSGRRPGWRQLRILELLRNRCGGHVRLASQ